MEIVDPDIASITAFGDPTATLAPAREVRERQRPSSKQRQGSQPKKTGGQPGKKRRDTSQRGDTSSTRGDRKPHRGQGSRQDDQRSEARRSDSNDRPRRTTEAQRDRQRQAEGDGSSRNNRGERRQSGPSSHRKGRRLASVVRLRAVTAKVEPLGLALQVVADKPCCNATSEHRAHHETSALR